jgi:hypothetical protein
MVSLIPSTIVLSVNAIISDNVGNCWKRGDINPKVFPNVLIIP